MEKRKWRLNISGENRLRRRVMLGEVSEFVYKEGGEEKMRRFPKVGSVVPLWVSGVEGECLRRMGLEGDFLVRIAGVRVEPKDDGGYRMWLRVERVSVLPEGYDLEAFVKVYWV